MHPVAVRPVDEPALLELQKAAADRLFLEPEKVRDILPAHRQMDLIQNRIQIVDSITESMPVTQVKNEYSQSLHGRALAEVVNQIEGILEHPEHHVHECTLRIGIVGQARRKSSPGPARNTRWHYRLYRKKIVVCSGQSDEIVAHQKAQYLPASISAGSTHHQHAVQYVEDMVSCFARVDQPVTGVQAARWRIIENIEENILTGLLAAHGQRMDVRCVTGKCREITLQASLESGLERMAPAIIFP